MKTRLLLFALILIICMLLAVPATATAQRIYVGSASFEMPEGFTVFKEGTKLTDNSTYANSQDDLIGYGVVALQISKPFYTTSGSLIDLIDTFWDLIEADEKKLISVGSGECVALRMKDEDGVQFVVFNRYDITYFALFVDDLSRYESDFLESFKIKETPIR